MKLIDKAALVAEIEKQNQLIFPKNTGEMKVADVPKPLEQGWLNALSWIKKTIDSLEVKEVDFEEKATQLSQKYFPNEENIWARPNIEAQNCKSACIEMVEWFKAQEGE